MVRYLITSFSKTGCAALSALRAVGEKDIVVGARNVAAAKDNIIGAGASHVVELDLDKVDSIKAALHGVDRALLTSAYSPNMAIWARSFVEAAKLNKVSFIARLSSCHKGDAFKLPMEADQAFKDSGLRYVLIQPTFFMENLIGSKEAAKGGQLHGAAGDGRAPYISVEDIGAASAAVLKNPDLASGELPIVNAKAYTEAEVWAAIGQAAYGKPVQYVSHTPDEFKAILEKRTLPPGVKPERLLVFEEEKRSGRIQPDPTNFERIVGRRQMTIEQWAAKTAAAFK